MEDHISYRVYTSSLDSLYFSFSCVLFEAHDDMKLELGMIGSGHY